MTYTLEHFSKLLTAAPAEKLLVGIFKYKIWFKINYKVMVKMLPTYLSK